MELVEALKILGWGDRNQYKPDVLKQAVIILEKECNALAVPILGKFFSPREESFISPGDILQQVVVDFLCRTTPLPGDPPSSLQSARAYLRRIIKNRLISLIRKHKSEKTTDLYFLNDDGEFEERELPASEEIMQNPELPSLCDDWREGLESILDFIEELVFETEEIKEEYLEDFRAYWPRIRSAVIDSAQSLRSESFRFQHYETFWRCVACAFKYTTMEDEVRRLFEGQEVPVPDPLSGEYKKERNRLDQQNSRTMRRIFEAMRKANVDNSIAIRFVQALSPRGPMSQSDEG